MIKLSIIVPIYNVEEYLRKCLDSLMAQTYSNLEIILIDDGSPDNCGVICDEYKERDSRFVVIHKPNGGLSTAWNCGLDRATGDYLTFVDSDDWVDVDYFEQIVKSIGDREFDLFMTCGHVIETSDGGHHEVHTFDQPFIVQERNEKNELLVRTLVRTHAANGELYQNFGVVWDKIYRTAFIRDQGFRFTSSLVTKCSWIDSLFVFQAIDQAGIILGGNVIGYHYRMVDFSQTRKYNPYLPTAYEAYFDELNSYIQNNVLVDKCQGGGILPAAASGHSAEDAY